MLVDLARKGNSITAIACEIGVTRDTLYEWAKPSNVDKYPFFSDAFSRAKDFRQVWYEKFFVNGAAGKIKNFQTGAAIWASRQVLGWNDEGNQEENLNEIEGLMFE